MNMKKNFRFFSLAIAALVLANCSQTPERVAGKSGMDPKYGVVASPRVVEEGQTVPKGGGRDMIGKPYTIAGKRYAPYDKPVGYKIAGTASWYGAAFHGRRTANGEIFDRHALMAAHPTMPLPSYARVTNQRNQNSIIVRVNDRGPYHGGRVLDISEKAAQLLEFKHMGTAPITVEYLGRAEIVGSDDRKLLATLRTDGNPAPFPGTTGRTLLASASPDFVPSSSAALSPASGAAVPALAKPVVSEPITTAALRESAQSALENTPSAEKSSSPFNPLGSPTVQVMILPPERPAVLASVVSAAKPPHQETDALKKNSADLEEASDDSSLPETPEAKNIPVFLKGIPLPPIRPVETKRTVQNSASGSTAEKI
jgi:rare lipoprotein A